MPPAAQAMRERVRRFLDAAAGDGVFVPHAPDADGAHSPEFSRRCGAAGFIGMTWPLALGGHGLSHLERYVVTEEMLAVSAPVRAHWVADRQSGPLLIRYGHASVQAEVLPRIVRGECYFCIGMSEPDSGSDLFSARSSATPADGGWRVNGRKLWTSNAHCSHYMIALLRTSPPAEDNRRHGLSQFLIAMDSPGITVRPVPNLTGAADFNEVTFDDVQVPAEHLIGEVDQAWRQATSELAYERSGPERFLETIYLLHALVRTAGTDPDPRVAEGVGRLVAELATLREMSLSVAGMLEGGAVPDVQAALVKDLGTNWEQALPARVRDLLPQIEPSLDNAQDLESLLGYATLIAPKLTIQGGTREILRGIIARALGLR
jgi:alkylation response protein AidB-like acyl-CoA dehydrogenase